MGVVVYLGWQYRDRTGVLEGGQNSVRRSRSRRVVMRWARSPDGDDGDIR
jgi:hypothetical protein